MSTFVSGFVPILLMWALPLFPMICAGIAASVEALASPVRVEQTKG